MEQEIKDVASSVPSSVLEKVEKALSGLLNRYVCSNTSSPSPINIEDKRSNTVDTVLTLVGKLNTDGAAAVGSGATAANLVASVGRVAETAKKIADVSKCVGGVSSIFHLVAPGAQGASTCMEANRGRKVLPVALGRVGVLLEHVLKSLGGIMTSSRDADVTEIDFVFDTLKQAVRAMDMAETQQLRGRGREFMNAEDVEQAERKIQELRQMAVIAGNASKICSVDEEVNKLKEEWNICDDELHHVRPSLSPFFSGRPMELGTLADILEKHGSAVITQYGGVGKTKLMIAFADRAERDEAVPGSVFWVTIDGGERDLIESLAELAEKLTQRKIGEKSRRGGDLIVAVLKQGLDKRAGLWLLCLDNAHDGKVNGTLNEVRVISGGPRGNGWVVVTSCNELKVD